MGGEAALKVDYQNGRFHFQASAGFAYGFGMKGSIQWSVDAREGWMLLGHLLDCVDFHKVRELTGVAYTAYSNYAMLYHLSGQIQAQAQLELAKQSSDWALAKVKQVREWFMGKEIDFLKAKAAISGNAGERSALVKMSPETLGMYLSTILRTREKEDFRTILYILGSTVHWKDKGNSLSNDHKLKWVLRYISDVEIPSSPGPLKDQKKEEALKKGILLIERFGKGFGYTDKLGANEAFLIEFNTLLTQNGIPNR